MIKIKKDLIDKTADEIRRVEKEFDQFSYQKRFNVTKEVILNALIGGDRTKEVLIIAQKKIEKNKSVNENSKTFKFVHPHLSLTEILSKEKIAKTIF